MEGASAKERRRVSIVNRWKEIWNKRNKDISMTDDIFDMFCRLKKADGYDTQMEEGYFEGFFEEWKRMKRELCRHCSGFQSVYEVGCGSGVNLYLFQRLSNIERAGGIDYSKPLIEMAELILKDADLKYGEAEEMDIFPAYDIVLSEAVFIYFQDTDYGLRILEKMFKKAEKAVVVKEIFDLEKKEACMEARRACVENYDEHYKGLEKTFYSREMFIKFAEEKGCKYKIVEPQNKHYWNNDYVFDFYLFK